MELWKTTMENMVINSSFWKNKKVLLTGHTGFKGSWLSVWLQKLGVNLIGFSNSIPTKPSLFELANVKDGMISLTGDIRDLIHLKEVIRDHKPEIIIHMAAQSLVHESYNNPVETYATNVMGTVNLLEAIRTIGKVRVIINVTSDKCYENKEWTRGYKEDDPMGGHDPYSGSKGCAELVTSSFRNSFFNPTQFEKHAVAIASVRSGNVIGGGDWATDRLVPDIMKGILDNQPIKIRKPDAIRPWQFVLDPLNGYLLLAEKLWNEGSAYIGSWNFGPNEENIKQVSWLVEKLTQLWGNKTYYEIDNENYGHEATILKLDCSKANTKLGWFPKIDIEQALQWTVDWYRQYEKNNSIREFTERQIDNFNLLSCHKQQ